MADLQLTNPSGKMPEPNSASFGLEPSELPQAQLGGSSIGNRPTMTNDLPTEIPGLAEFIVKSRDGLVRGVLRTITERGGSEATAMVSRFLAKHHANIEGMYGNSMGVVYGQFTLFAAAPESMDGILESYQRELATIPSELILTEKTEVLPKDELLKLSLYAIESKDTVAKIARAISDYEANIVSASGASYAAPFAGGIQLFCLSLNIHLSDTSRHSSLCDSLRQLAKECVWDLQIDSLK